MTQTTVVSTHRTLWAFYLKMASFSRNTTSNWELNIPVIEHGVHYWHGADLAYMASSSKYVKLTIHLIEMLFEWIMCYSQLMTLWSNRCMWLYSQTLDSRSKDCSTAMDALAELINRKKKAKKQKIWRNVSFSWKWQAQCGIAACSLLISFTDLMLVMRMRMTKTRSNLKKNCYAKASEGKENC